MYDVLLGGKDNYEADRALAAELLAVAPDLPVMVQAHRLLLRRLVRFLVGETGLRQLLDVGTGIPTTENVHDMARVVAPDTHVVYVDNDPFVLAHARALLRVGPARSTAVVDGDLREPERLLGGRSLRRVLDLDRPVGVLLAAVLQHLSDADAPHDVVRRLLDGLAPGSMLAIVVPASDLRPDVVPALVHVAEQAGIAVTPRSRAEVARFVRGLEIVPPGVAQLLDWRPDETQAELGVLHDVPAWVVVGRKP